MALVLPTDHPLLIGTALLGLLFVFLLRRGSPKAGRLPPGPKGLPIIGALPFVGPDAHSGFKALSDRYGPVMFLKMGSANVVVASSPDAARTFLKNLDLQYANRPAVISGKDITYNYQNFVFADYNPRYKLLRKLLNVHMLGPKALAEWAPVRRHEIRLMIKSMLEMSRRSEAMELPEMMICANANIMGQVMLSKRVFAATGEASSKYKDTIMEVLTGTGMFSIGDFVPWLAWMDLQGVQGRLKQSHENMDKMISGIVDEHRENKEGRKKDVLDMILENRVDADGEELTDTNIKALFSDMFLAGTDTSTIIVEWAIAEMLKNPTIMKKAQAELDQVIGKNRLFEEADISKLPYLRAVVKEALRLHPSTPLSLPHYSFEACEIDGYYIPENTRLLVNVWAIGRDPKVWSEPLEFKPERFVSGPESKLEPLGNDFGFIPFGAGRRICPGMQAGMTFLHTFLATLIHAFDWRLADGEKLDMVEKFGLVLPKKVPLRLMATPRLASEAYNN